MESTPRLHPQLGKIMAENLDHVRMVQAVHVDDQRVDSILLHTLTPIPQVSLSCMYACMYLCMHVCWQCYKQKAHVKCDGSPKCYDCIRAFTHELPVCALPH